MPLIINSPLHRAALETDHAWSAELVRLYAHAAGDARYTKTGKGAPGTMLRVLYEARMAANAAWRKEVEA